ncbi:MAG: multiheme c-type cytochrome, partial [Gammaproteobacteria bacterium]
MLKYFVIGLLWLSSCGVVAAGESATPHYVGGSACAGCHPQQTSQWLGSPHDLAMQAADDATVLGDFANATMTYNGVTSRFYRKDGKFMVRTDGPDGSLRDYEVKYTFGADPLQQYLIEFPGGRLQALSLAWDARSKAQGGQRWFHLYPDEKVDHNDVLHWTRSSQNWNSMCAECHSTHLRKNYDPAERRFDTDWSDIDVACEACHGPGSDHLAWAHNKSGDAGAQSAKGLVLTLDERRGVNWASDGKTGKPVRSRTRDTEKEIQMCARCHSRRSPISRDYVHGEPLLDHYIPRLLDRGMYYADGQIEDEVYVYGSFLQSKMYRAGVTCSDCHDPHSLELRSPGNGVCLQCHAAETYDTAGHHFHKPGSRGGSCAECHMPPKTYMVVDPRHDHSMRIPRPDLSVQLGTPNACTNCHAERTDDWAAKQVATWYGGQPEGYQRYAEALAAARAGAPGAGEQLAGLVRATDVAGIARATALAGLGPYLGPTTIDAVADGVFDDDPLLRLAAVQALEAAPPNLQAQLLFRLLDDPVRAVRIEAARVLAAFSAGDLPAAQRALLARELDEYRESQRVMAERPEAQVNLGNLDVALGNPDAAETAYRTAMELRAEFAPAYVNLADLLRSRGDEAAAEKVLRLGAERIPDSAAVQHSLGLSLVRQKRS